MRGLEMEMFVTSWRGWRRKGGILLWRKNEAYLCAFCIASSSLEESKLKCQNLHSGEELPFAETQLKIRARKPRGDTESLREKKSGEKKKYIN